MQTNAKVVCACTKLCVNSCICARLPSIFGLILKKTGYVSLSLLSTSMFDFQDSFCEAIFFCVNENQHKLLNTLLLTLPPSTATTRLLDQKDKENMTALMLACCYGYHECASVLIANGANIHTQDENGLNALMYASNGSVRCLELLLKCGVDIQHKAANGWSGVIHAIDCCHEECLHLLLIYNSDVHLRDSNGMTPLIYACSHRRSPSIVQLLLDYNSDVNLQDNTGMSALHFACAYGFEKVALMLLLHGASVHIRNNDGRDCFDLAAAHIKSSRNNNNNNNKSMTILLSQYVQGTSEHILK